MAESAGRLKRFDERLSRLSRFSQLLLSVLLLCLCALADYSTGSELSFSITYLAPTALAAWYAGAAAGMIMAALASLTWLIIDQISGQGYSSTMIPVWNSLVRLGFFLIVTTLLLQIRRLLDRLREQAGTDGLTGLVNSRIFLQRVEQERERALRYGHPFTVAYLDLDQFKLVNDTWGHETGDLVLRTIAGCVTGALRRTDLVARLGGDEFAILLAETGEREAAEALQKLHAKMQEQLAEQSWPVGCSIGAITCVDPTRVSVNELVRQADELMYQVKRSGKNRLLLQRVVIPDN